jgi:hypothetical protein
MSLQKIINMSSNIEVNRRKMVGVQYTRSQLPRTDMTVTKNPWKFRITVPNQPWNEMRSIIENLDYHDRYSPTVVSFNDNPNLAWLFRYQGDYAVTPFGISINSFVGNQMILSNLPDLDPALYLFRSGDIIQVSGMPYPFTVVNDVVRGTDTTVTITTHRPNILTNSVAGLTLLVGNNVNFNLFVAEMPTYKLSTGAIKYDSNGTLINNGIVEWSGTFDLYEWVSGA